MVVITDNIITNIIFTTIPKLNQYYYHISLEKHESTTFLGIEPLQINIPHITNLTHFQEPYITLTNEFTAQGVATTIKAIARISECNHLLGEDILEQAEVDQWMEHCLTKIIPFNHDKTETKDIIKVLSFGHYISPWNSVLQNVHLF